MRLLSCFLALALSASTALAADVSPLPVGKPAGVKHAQEWEHGTALYVVLGAAVIAGIALAASSGSDNAVTPPVNSSGSTA